MINKTLFCSLLLLFLFSCKKESNNSISTSQNISDTNTNNDLIEKDTIPLRRIENDTLKTNSSNDIIEYGAIIPPDSTKYSLEDLTFRIYPTFLNGDKHEYIGVPFILNNYDISFDTNQYPDTLTFRSIPTSLDTLEVVTGKPDCSDCLEIMKIRNKHQEKELYYEIKYHNEKIVHRGSIDTILNKRNLTHSDLFQNQYIVYKNDTWKAGEELSQNIYQDYIHAYNLEWIKTPDIAEINKQINNDPSKTSVIDSLKQSYQNKIIAQNNVSLDNLLSEIDHPNYEYFHSGGFSNKRDIGLILPIESLSVVFISEENEMYVVEWMKNYKKITDSIGTPLDDNYVKQMDNQHKIEKLDSNTKMRLFHSNMTPGKYIVIYETKLKYLDTYIQSPPQIITYKKPEKSQKE